MLVASPSRWDETCFSVPAVRALAASGLRMGILCPEEQSEFWNEVGNVSVHGFSPGAKRKVLASQIMGQWEASLAWGLDDAAEVFELAKISKRLGPALAGVKKRFTHPVAAVEGPLEHRVRFYLGLVEELGIPTQQAAYFAPADLGARTSTSAVLLCPESDFGLNHQWPQERWEALARRLLAQGRQITIVGLSTKGGLARSLAASLAASLEGAEFVHLPSFRGSLPFLADYFLVVAADGSLPHLAAFAGATCLTLFGPNDPTWKRPLGTQHRVVRRHVECAPCLLSKCPLDLRCQFELSLDQVIGAMNDLLVENGPGTSPSTPVVRISPQ